MTADLWHVLCLFWFVCSENAAVVIFSGHSGFCPHSKNRLRQLRHIRVYGDSKTHIKPLILGDFFFTFTVVSGVSCQPRHILSPWLEAYGSGPNTCISGYTVTIQCLVDIHSTARSRKGHGYK